MHRWGAYKSYLRINRLGQPFCCSAASQLVTYVPMVLSVFTLPIEQVFFTEQLISSKIVRRKLKVGTYSGNGRQRTSLKKRMPHTRGNEIRELFDNMAYNEIAEISIEKAINDLVKRHDICQDKDISLNNANELAKRLFEIADMVEKDRNALNDIFAKRVPIAIETPAKDIDLLISFSRYYATLIWQDTLWHHINIDGGTWPENAVSAVYYTLSMIIQSSHIQWYLKHISFGPRVVLGGHSSIDTAMVVMADADIYSAISTLTSERVRKTDYLDRPLWYLKKIWVQEPVKEKFVTLIDELQIKDNTSSIKSMLHGFRNRDDVLQSLAKEMYIKAVSIWSCDIVTAKNMANRMDNAFLVWINSYGEIGPGVSLPWTDVMHHNAINTVQHELTLKKRVDGKKTIDLFYDGMWKEPLNDVYWEDDIDNLWASATWDDVEKCVASADSGFKKWHSLPLSHRQKCFYRLASRIQSNKCPELSRSIRVWAESPIVHGFSSSRIQDSAIEIATTREPKGVVVIVCDDHDELFRRIVIAGVAGNAIIVANNRIGPSANISGIEEYCDMFATCGFPPGVINALSFHDLPNAITNLSKMRSIAVTCTDLYNVELETLKTYLPTPWITINSLDGDEKLYAKYTRPKSVWLPLK